MSLTVQNGMVMVIIASAVMYVVVQTMRLFFQEKQKACGTSCGGCAQDDSLGTPKPFVASEQLGNYSTTKFEPQVSNTVSK